MVVMAVISISFGVGLYTIGHARYGIAAAVSFSRFRDLEVNHAIETNPAALKNIVNAGLSSQSDVHTFVTEVFRGNLEVIDMAAITSLLNGVMWMVGGWMRVEKPNIVKLLPKDDESPW